MTMMALPGLGNWVACVPFAEETNAGSLNLRD